MESLRLKFLTFLSFKAQKGSINKGFGTLKLTHTHTNNFSPMLSRCCTNLIYTERFRYFSGSSYLVFSVFFFPKLYVQFLRYSRKNVPLKANFNYEKMPVSFLCLIFLGCRFQYFVLAYPAENEYLFYLLIVRSR